MHVLQRIVGFLDGLAELLGRFASVFAPLMLLVTLYVVVTRYVLNTGSVAVQDLVTYCNALIFTLGAGYALKHDAHVRVDIFYSQAAPRTKALINLVGTLLLLLPVMVFLLWTCWNYVASAWAIREGSPDTGGLPYVYLLKTLILVMGGVLILQGLAEALRSVQQLLDGRGPATTAATTLDEDNLL
jgi:TRAP-type mannitol/chloroaromatic compound transport system permease small subunit